MAQILFINASPRGERSHSAAVARAFLNALKEQHPEDEIVTINVFEERLPEMDGFAVQAKYTVMHGKDPSDEERAAWDLVTRTGEHFKAADKYVMAVPMWNFGIPYRLKQYVDLLVQPGLTFSFSPEEGYKGLVTGKPVFIVYASGGEYAPGTAGEPLDHRRRYLETILGYIGLNDIRSINVEPTVQQGPEVGRQRREEAIARAVEMAKVF